MTKSVRWTYALVGSVRKNIVDAVSGERGKCPLCGAELIAKMGECKAWHWAHWERDVCDEWYQPKGPWHRFWQSLFPETSREVVVERDGKKHIADIKTMNNIVVEVQWSPLSAEKIRERELFYDKMVWIVAAGEDSNNKRLSRFIREHVGNQSQAPRIWRADDAFFESVGWIHCGRPVFVDVEGTQDSPVSDGPLYYIMPKKEDEGIFVVEVRRCELIDALRTGMTKSFFSHLKKLKIECIKDEHDRRETEIARLRAEEIEWRQKRDAERKLSAERYLSHSDCEKNAIAFVHKEFHHPPRCSLTLGWVEAFLVMEGDLEHITINLPKASVAPYGRVAVHLNPIYTREDYEWDCRRAKKMGLPDDIEDYDVLSKYYSGKIVGCVDYLVKHTDKGLCLTFKDPDRFLRRNDKAWTYANSERTFWSLSEQSQTYLGNVDIQSRTYGAF